jgi:hypothetical protein
MLILNIPVYGIVMWEKQHPLWMWGLVCRRLAETKQCHRIMTCHHEEGQRCLLQDYDLYFQETKIFLALDVVTPQLSLIFQHCSVFTAITIIATVMVILQTLKCFAFISFGVNIFTVLLHCNFCEFTLFNECIIINYQPSQIVKLWHILEEFISCL